MRLDERHVELRPESTNPTHRPLAVDLAAIELHIDGVAMGALLGIGQDGGAFSAESPN